MPSLPTVSVIVATYNSLGTLPKALESIGPRTDLEIVVFDDGSTDGTADWLAEAANRDPRIVALHGLGIGPSKARNQAIAAARAPLLAFLDAGACWHPGKLPAQLALHAAWPEAGFSFTDFRRIAETGEVQGTCFGHRPHFRQRICGRTGPVALGGDALALLFAENVVGTSTVMARTDLVRSLNGFAEDLPSAETWDLWLRLAHRAPVMCLPGVYADETVSGGGATAKLRARALAMRMIGARHRNKVRKIRRRAVRGFMSGLMEADAEIAVLTGQTWGELGCRVAAFALAPSHRAACAAAAALRRALMPRRAGGTPGARSQ